MVDTPRKGQSQAREHLPVAREVRHGPNRQLLRCLIRVWVTLRSGYLRIELTSLIPQRHTVIRPSTVKTGPPPTYQHLFEVRRHKEKQPEKARRLRRLLNCKSVKGPLAALMGEIRQEINND